MNSDLFDLSKYSSSYKGYWVDVNGKVYSTKQGALRALKASGTGSHQYWSLSNGSYSTGYRTDRFARDLQSSQSYCAWKETQKGEAVFTPASTSTSSKGYMVGSAAGENVSFSSQPKVHSTEAAARQECERLAAAHKGKTFLYVEIKGTVKASGFAWN